MAEWLRLKAVTERVSLEILTKVARKLMGLHGPHGFKSHPRRSPFYSKRMPVHAVRKSLHGHNAVLTELVAHHSAASRE